MAGQHLSRSVKSVFWTAPISAVVPYRTHLSPNHGPFPFPKDMFLKFVRENNGYFPVKIQALADGTCVHVHTPIYQVCHTASAGSAGVMPCHVAACTFLKAPSTSRALRPHMRGPVQPCHTPGAALV
jgi:nicotinamide phosphoribosyltransferase